MTWALLSFDTVLRYSCLHNVINVIIKVSMQGRKIALGAPKKVPFLPLWHISGNIYLLYGRRKWGYG